MNLIHISLCVCLYICFCEVQLSCTNSLYLMQLDFKLKKNERNEKENLLCTICLLPLFWNCQQMSIR